MEYRNDIQIGKLIKKIFEEKNITKDQLANAARCCRSSVYNIFDAKSIDTDMLIQIRALLVMSNQNMNLNLIEIDI